MASNVLVNVSAETIDTLGHAIPPAQALELSTIVLTTLAGNNTTNDEYIDYIPHDPFKSNACLTFKFVFFGVFIGLLCILGFLGNTLSFIILHKDRSGGTAHAATFLLKALALADNFVLTVSFVFLSFLYGFLPFFNANDVIQQLTPFIFKYIAPIAHMAQTATVWMTVMLAINRYIAICRPFDAYKKTSKKVARIQVIAVYLFAVLFNVPRFFQFDIVKNDSNMTIYQPTSIGPKTTFGKVYTNGLYTALVLFLPIVILLVLNIKLIMELRRMRQRSYKVNKGGSCEGNLTNIMIILIIIFIACNLPDRINEIMKAVYLVRPACSSHFVLDSISTGLIVLNSSTNFLVYYILRRRFRKSLMQFIRCQKRPSDDDSVELKRTNGKNKDLITYNGLNISKTLATSEEVL